MRPPVPPFDATKAADKSTRRRDRGSPKKIPIVCMLSPKQAGLAGATPTGRGNDGRSVSCSFPFIAARRFLGKVQRRRRGSASNTAFQIGRPGRRRGLFCNKLPRLADEFFGDSTDPRIVRRDMRPDFRLPGRALLSAEKRRCRPCSELADRRHGADFVWSTLVGGRHRRRRGYRRDDGDAHRSSPGRFKSRDRLHVSARMGIRDLSDPCRRPSPCCSGARLQ